MALSDHKITDAAIAEKGVVAAPDQLSGSARTNKMLFDRLIREAVKEDYNGLIDALMAATGAGEIGAAVDGLTGATIQAILNSIKTALDSKISSAVTEAALALKSDKAVTNKHIKSVELDEATGTFTFTRENGTKIVIDTALEKVAVNFTYDEDSQSLILTLADDSTETVSLAAFVTTTEFDDSGTIEWSVSGSKVKATVKEGSITDTMLSSALKAMLMGYVNRAATSATNAASSERNAASSAATANSARYSAESAADNAASSQSAAKQSENNAKTYESRASSSANNARLSETKASTYASSAAESIKHAPRINSSGKWELWDATQGAYVATEYTAIGEDGTKWYVYTKGVMNSGGTHIIEPVDTTMVVGDFLLQTFQSTYNIYTITGIAPTTVSGEEKYYVSLGYVGNIKGDKGDKGDPGSDANVTFANIIAALGYTPVNPNQIVWATPEQYGAVGDGATDDTNAINACLAANRNVIFAKTYRVKADKNNYNGSSAPDRYTYGVSVPSGRTLLFGGGSKLVCQTSNAAYSAALYLYGTSDVSIIGATIEGDRETNTLTTGEWGHGIVCRAANDVTIRDCTIYNCFGDGIVIGTSTATDENAIGSNICVENCKIYNNRRQGITVGGGKNITIKDCEIYEINGTAPQAGIDIETNKAATEVSNLLISNCYFHDNATWDITNTNGAQTGIVIEDCRCNGKVNVGTGEVAICGGSYRCICPVGGQITISDVTVAQIFGNPQGTVVRSSKIIGNEADSYTIAFDQDIGCDLTLIGCEITDVRNIIAKSTGIITFLDCKVVHKTDRSFSSQGHIRAFNTVFDFSDAAVNTQPVNCATIELNNCDFYTAGNGPLIGINDETTAKDWINNRFHGSLTTLSYKANRLIKNFFNFSHTKIKSTATGARIGNVWSDLDEGATTDAEKETWNNKQNAIPDLETIRTNATAGAAKVSCTDATVESYGYLKLGDLPKYEGGVS